MFIKLIFLVMSGKHNALLTAINCGIVYVYLITQFTAANKVWPQGLNKLGYVVARCTPSRLVFT